MLVASDEATAGTVIEKQDRFAFEERHQPPLLLLLGAEHGDDLHVPVSGRRSWWLQVRGTDSNPTFRRAVRSPARRPAPIQGR